jgi:hypothetical protein
MNSFLRFFIFASLIFILSACSTEPPRVRVSNQQGLIVDVQLKRSGGNTYNINDVSGFSATGYIDVDRSVYEVDAKLEDNNKHATTHFTAEEDQTYTIIVTGANPPAVTVVKP